MNDAAGSVGARRALAMLLLVGFIAVVLGLPWQLHRWYQERSEKLVDLIELRSRLAGAAAAASPKDQAADQKLVETHMVAFLRGADESVIAADLQSRLRALVAGKSCELSSVRVLPVKTVANQRMLGLRIQVRGALKGIRDLLQLIEGQKPFLFVDRAVLRLEEQRGAVRETSEDVLSAMYAEMDIYGALWSEPAQDSKEESLR